MQETSANAKLYIPDGGSNLEIEACLSRSAITQVAINYAYHVKYLTSTNITGSCIGRGKPHYLGGAGNYTGISYDWGGFDTISGFDSYMDSGKQAGDIDINNPAFPTPTPSGVETCSKGVDCSGFVSRTWGLTTKKSTWNIGDVSWQLGSKNNLLEGDILNYPGFHMVLVTVHLVRGLSEKMVSAGGVHPLRTPFFRVLTPFRWEN